MSYNDTFGEDILDLDGVLETKTGILEGYDDRDAEDALTYLRLVYELEQELGERLEDYRGDSQLIHENYFEDYAQQLADDIGAIDANANWPLNHIDWEAAADELKTDYTVFTVDGDDYYAR